MLPFIHHRHSLCLLHHFAILFSLLASFSFSYLFSSGSLVILNSKLLVNRSQTCRSAGCPAHFHTGARIWRALSTRTPHFLVWDQCGWCHRHDACSPGPGGAAWLFALQWAKEYPDSHTSLLMTANSYLIPRMPLQSAFHIDHDGKTDQTFVNCACGLL